jgi:hypothetical protein
MREEIIMRTTMKRFSAHIGVAILTFYRDCHLVGESVATHGVG